MNKKVSFILSLCLVAVMALTGCSSETTGTNGGTVNTETGTTTTTTTTDENGKTTTVTTITNTDGSTTVVSSNPAEDASDSYVEITEDFKITTDVEGGYSQDGNVYYISKAGEYTLTGKLSEGRIVVNVGDEDEVTLNLEGVSITSTENSVIYVENAECVTIKAKKDTYNELTDARSLKSSYDTEDEESDSLGTACIYSKDDLKIQGKGSLVINASYNNGIHTKNDLTIKNVTLKVTCPNNALKGNDS
ncbi:MAG: carbohydrate-binding domain-containing protein, partial [Lachnospiraceae bacterium]|nr:carbohydrate-binding domain-containing protein [Lachnospiraceae bacterium]